MRDAPTLRNVELEQVGKFLCRWPGDGVSPRTKRDEQISVLIECQVAMHHGAEANGADRFERGVVFFRYLVAKIPIAHLQARPNNVEAVGPDAVFISVFPLIAT